MEKYYNSIININELEDNVFSLNRNVNSLIQKVKQYQLFDTQRQKEIENNLLTQKESLITLDKSFIKLFEDLKKGM